MVINTLLFDVIHSKYLGKDRLYEINRKNKNYNSTT